MTDKIHDYAQSTTPATVQVPNNLAGLLTWAVGKFGGAAIFAGLAIYALCIVYDDMKAQSAIVLRAFIQQTASNYAVADAMNRMAVAVNQPRPDIKPVEREP